MTRVLMFGFGPLPDEGLRVAAPGLRAWHFARVLHDAGHAICLITDRTFGHYPDDLPDLTTRTAERWTVHSVTDARWHNPATMRALIEPFRADCAVAVTTTACAVAAPLIGDLPLWADMYGSLMAEAQMKALLYSDDTYLPYFWNLERRAIERGDIFSTVSERQRWGLIGELGMWGRLNQWTSAYDFATCIPIASETRPYDPPRKVIRGVLAAENDFVILYSGGYNTWTDVDTLFGALERIMARFPGVQFVSTGGKIDGHDDLTYLRFERMVSGSAYRDRLHLCGWVPGAEVPGYYLESNLGINVDRTSYEAMLGSRTRVLDWMRAGLPVVLSSLTELSEQVGLACAGLVYQPGSVDDLVRCLAQCIENPAETRAMGERARALLLEKFTFEVTTAKLREWAAKPMHAPDYGRSTALVKSGAGLGREITSAVARGSLGLDLATRLWPHVARVIHAVGLGKLERRIVKIGMRALRLDRPPYRVRFLAFDVPTRMIAGATVACRVRLRNEGTTPWISEVNGEHAVTLSYHWRSEAGVTLIEEGRRTVLPMTLAGGRTVEVVMHIDAPPQSATYRLDLDLVREGITWFSQIGSPGPSVVINVYAP